MEILISDVYPEIVWHIPPCWTRPGKLVYYTFHNSDIGQLNTEYIELCWAP